MHAASTARLSGLRSAYRSGRHLKRYKCVSSAAPAASRSALFLSPVWPERTSSAAGVRSSELLQAFRRWGFQVSYGAAAAPNEHTQLLAEQGVRVHQVVPNREQQLAAVLEAACPDIVLFDRFFAEEYYSFRVRELAPSALRVLDMQDMHSLRSAREAAAKAGAPPSAVLNCLPDATAPDCLRELAAIHRSDLTLVCSPVELDLLVSHFGVPAHKLALAPLFYPPSPHDPTVAAAAAAAAGSSSAGPDQGAPSFSARRHMMMIGNFLHKPNLDSVREACRLWPLVRQQLPGGGTDVELHIYGAYPPGSASQQFHRPRDGIHLKGFAPCLDIMLGYRLLLAPLRFGAGLKGKVADSWWHGLPVVTTAVGAEGMQLPPQEQQAQPRCVDPAAEGYTWQEGGSASSSSGGGGTQQTWGGLCCADTIEELAADVARLYTDAELWSACQQAGFRLLRQLYDRDATMEVVRLAVWDALQHVEQRRRLDFTGQLLWQQQFRATAFMSKYIELKETATTATAGGSGGIA